MRLRNVQDAAAWRLCVGCGACAYICPHGNVSLRNRPADGIRPVVAEETCRQCGECLTACPGVEITAGNGQGAGRAIKGLAQGWGTVLDIHEGCAADEEIRYQGSSGGLATALALYCLEKGGMEGVLHTGPDEARPLENRTHFSTDRSQLLSRTGSRYSPASPCDGLGRIEDAGSQCVFVGKPCDVTALQKARRLRPGLDEKVGISIGIFCAGTPALQGTLDLLDRLGLDPSSIEELRYRGRGWPGKFAVRQKGDSTFTVGATYMDAWGFIQKYRPYRCHLCPDGTGEFADISCGDPWYRAVDEREQGRSLVLVRTEKGRAILNGAVREGYVVLDKVEARILPRSQVNLLGKRRAVWGRLLALGLLGIPRPRLRGFHLFANWRFLSLGEQTRSVAGTLRRSVQRRYYRPVKGRGR